MIRRLARLLLAVLLEVSLLLLVAGALLALLAFLAGRRILWNESDPLERAAGRFEHGLELVALAARGVARAQAARNETRT